MTASPEMLAAFHRWRLAELATHFAAGGPDEVMDALVDVLATEVRALANTPATSADDLVLKLLPLTLMVHEPPAGTPPLAPVQAVEPGTDYNEDVLWRSVIGDLPAVSAVVREAIATPHSSTAEQQDDPPNVLPAREG
jgi:hypothetical protein